MKKLTSRNAGENKVGSGRNITRRNERTFLRGSLMFIEGESSSEMFIIKNGKVRILRQEGEKAVELAVLGGGSVLGELSLLDQQPRSATAQVVEDTVVSVVDEAMLEQTLASIPNWLANIVKVVVKRLRDTMKKNVDNLVGKSVGGVIRIILLLKETQGQIVDNEFRIGLRIVKRTIADIIGIGELESENVLLHLIIKNLIFIRKDATGEEYVILRDPEALQLYMNYQRTKLRGGRMPGENLPKESVELARCIVDCGRENGRKIKEKVYRVGLQQIAVQQARSGGAKDIHPDSLDGLLDAKAILMEQGKTESTHGTHKSAGIIYNEESLKRILLLHQWIDVFREDVEF